MNFHALIFPWKKITNTYTIAKRDSQTKLILGKNIFTSDSVDLDQTAQRVQPGLGSTQKILKKKTKFETALFALLLQL